MDVGKIHGFMLGSQRPFLGPSLNARTRGIHSMDKVPFVEINGHAKLHIFFITTKRVFEGVFTTLAE